MDSTVSFQCHFCGEPQEAVIDEEFGGQDFTVDCENCCRPMHVKVIVDGSGDAMSFHIEVDPG